MSSIDSMWNIFRERGDDDEWCQNPYSPLQRQLTATNPRLIKDALSQERGIKHKYEQANRGTFKNTAQMRFWALQANSQNPPRIGDFHSFFNYFCPPLPNLLWDVETFKGGKLEALDLFLWNSMITRRHSVIRNVRMRVLVSWEQIYKAEREMQLWW